MIIRPYGINFIATRSYDILEIMNLKRLFSRHADTRAVLPLLRQKKKVYVAPKAPLVTPPHQTVMPPPQPPPAVWTVDNALLPAAVAPELRDDEAAQTLLDAIDLSLAKFAAMDSAAVLRFGAEAVPVARVVASLKDFRAKLAETGLSEEFFRYLRENYRFLFQRRAAGHFHRLLRAAAARLAPRVAAVPLPAVRPPRRPGDRRPAAVLFLQGPARPAPRSRAGWTATASSPTTPASEIDFRSQLPGRSLEIVWIDSLVDIFFLHIQGSGIVQLEDGSRIYVGYADQNGLPFRSTRQVPARQAAHRPRPALPAGDEGLSEGAPRSHPRGPHFQSQLHFFSGQPSRARPARSAPA